MATKLPSSLKSIGDYTLLKKLGEGGMGAVYKARDSRNGRVVALKIVTDDAAKNPLLMERFKQEFRATQALNHPNIVKGLDFGVEGEASYLAMEFVEGESLGDRLDRAGKIPEMEAVAIICQVAGALHLAHKHQIIHRDVKPDNILVTSQGVAKLTDLGLAKDWQSELDLTRPESGLGTPNFMAPEQFGDAKHADARFDVYSLGASLYMAVTGEIPFRAKGNLAILKKKMLNDLVPPRKVTPKISSRTEIAILKALRCDREERYADCMEFIEALAPEGTLRPTSDTKRHKVLPTLAEHVESQADGHNQKDRRAAVRYPSEAESNCQPASRVKERSWNARVQDISSSGICLILGRRFEPGTILAAEIQTKKAAMRNTCLVRVERVKEVEKGKFSLGCSFERTLTESELKGFS